MNQKQDFSDYWVFKPFLENHSQEDKEKQFHALYDYMKLCINSNQTQSIENAIKMGLELDFKTHDTQSSLLKQSVTDGENQMVQYLCEKDININTTDYEKDTALHTIIKHLYYLLEKYSIYDYEIKNRTDILHTLFIHNINPFIKNGKNNTALDVINNSIEEEKENSLSFNDDSFDELITLTKKPLEIYQQKYILENKKQQHNLPQKKKPIL